MVSEKSGSIRDQKRFYNIYRLVNFPIMMEVGTLSRTNASKKREDVDRCASIFLSRGSFLLILLLRGTANVADLRQCKGWGMFCRSVDEPTIGIGLSES